MKGQPVATEAVPVQALFSACWCWPADRNFSRSANVFACSRGVASLRRNSELTFQGVNKACKRVLGSDGADLEPEFLSNLCSSWADRHDNGRSVSPEGRYPTRGGRPAGEHKGIDVIELPRLWHPEPRRVRSHHGDIVARSAQQVGQRVGCTVSLRKQNADMLLSQTHVQRRSQLDSDLAVWNHIDRSPGEISKHARRGGANRRQRHAWVLFCCSADTLGTDS